MKLEAAGKTEDAHKAKFASKNTLEVWLYIDIRTLHINIECILHIKYHSHLVQYNIVSAQRWILEMVSGVCVWSK